MEIQTKIIFKDYWNLHLNNFPKNVLSLLIIFLVPIVLSIYFYKIFEDTFQNNNLIYFIILLIFIFIYFPYRHYKTIKKVFYSNKKIQENIIYTFNEEKIHVKGESFESEFTWKSIFKLKELKDWFLIYQSMNVMNIVPKKNFTKEQIHELRQIILKNELKAKLKND